MLCATLDDLRHHDSPFWRRAISAGVSHGPDAFVRYSPPLFGLVFAAALPAQRRAARATLERSQGERGGVRAAVDVARLFANYASCLTDTFVAGSDRGDRLELHAHDADRIATAVAAGKGVIVVTAHTGGWQVVGPALGSFGAEVLLVMRRELDGRSQALQDEVRARAGVRVVYVGDGPLDALPILAHLRRGGVAALQIDRVPAGVRSIPTELFGAPYEVPEGPFRLAAMTGAPILPVFTKRLGYMEYDVHVAPAVHLMRRPPSAELSAAARAVAGAMEAFVRANPTQWFHFE